MIDSDLPRLVNFFVNKKLKEKSYSTSKMGDAQMPKPVRFLIGGLSGYVYFK